MPDSLRGKNILFLVLALSHLALAALRSREGYTHKRRSVLSSVSPDILS